MTEFKVPSKEEVSLQNQEIFDSLSKSIGFVPNMYTFMAHSPTALNDYLALQNRKSSLTAKEREMVNLVVSQLNFCKYCLSAHTAIAKMHGFTEEEIFNIRQVKSSFNEKPDTLIKLTKEIVLQRGKPNEKYITDFFVAGYNHENLIDLIMLIGDKSITNYLHGIINIAIDFPLANELPAE